MAYTKVIVDWTKKVGCIDCIRFRRNHIKPSHLRHDWHVCNQHKKCVEFQHLSHQPGLDTNAAEKLDASAEEHYARLAEIETEDGSVEREMNKLTENRFNHDAPKHDPMTCKDITHDYCMNKQEQVMLESKHKEIKTSTADSSLLSVLLPMCAKARAACEEHASRAL